MILDDSLSAPRDLKQVQNTKHLEQKKKRCKVSKDSNQNRRKNTSDDIITLLNSVHDHPFIQAIIQTKGKPPAVILYLKEQIDEIWAAKSIIETWFLKFLKGTPKAEKAVKSTDGRLTIHVPKTQKTARKPGQRKRVKCSRTKKC
jgi:hypothetical protein